MEQTPPTEPPADPSASKSNKTEMLPLFPLGTVLVPEMSLSLHVFEPRYRQLMSDLLGENSQPTAGAPMFGVVALRQGWEVGELSDVHEVGTTARITDIVPHADGRCDVAALGDRRFVIESIDTTSQPYLVAEVHYLGEPDGDIASGDVAAARQAWASHLAALSAISSGSLQVSEISPPGGSDRSLSYAIAELPSLPLEDRQLLLACPDTATRLSAGRRILRRETILVRHLRAIPAPASAFRSGNRRG
ncbi:LON peptidase substrate-binding domain-containing protein [Jatrophihabitans sp. DSM 45814]